MFSKLRSDFPYFKLHKDLIYLDNAATTHKPQQVIDAISDFYAQSYAPVYRSIYTGAEKATQLYEDARSTVADFIKADQNEIAFTKGTTESINLVAAALEDYFVPGDEIVISELEHHANLVPWQQLARKKNLIVRYIPVDQNAVLNLDRLDTLITHKTKLVAVTHCSNVTGIFTDRETIVKRARQVGALVLLDAAQSIAHRKIDVKALDADFLVFSGHKLFAPTGIGILYAHKRIHSLLAPYQTGGAMVYSVSYTDSSWRPFPYLFEAGTPNISGALGLAAALNYIQKNIDFKVLEEHEKNLGALVLTEFASLDKIKIVGDPLLIAESGHCISFTLENWHPHDLAAYLDTHHIAVRAGHHCAQPLHNKLALSGSVRISFSFYTSSEDIIKMLAVIKKL